MSTDLGQQADFANDLNRILSEVNVKLQNINNSFSQQSSLAQNLANSLAKASEYLGDISVTSQNINNIFFEYSRKLQQSVKSGQTTEYFDNFADSMEKIHERYESNSTAAQELNETAQDMNEAANKAQQASEKTSQKAALVYGNQNRILSITNSITADLSQTTKGLAAKSEDMAEQMDKATESTGKFAKGLMSALSAAKGFFNVIGSLLSTIGSYVKAAVTLPVFILSKVVEVGNFLRTQLVETIEQAAQDTKEFFDSQSSIGQGIRKLTTMGKGMLLTFEDYNSSAVKLFGAGSEGIANMIRETSESIKDMGVFSEYFAETVSGPKSVFHFTRLKRILGLSAEDLKYYAQDAAVNLIGLNQRLETIAFMSEAVSKEYGVDMKRLSLNFHKLRKEISIFGHLSDEELLKTSARLTQMKMTTESAAEIFKKFNTFEDAANSVAMLSQTFGMNLDAMKIIKAENPIEIIDMFRESMLMTGRTFEDLSRFEKGILEEQTGISQENLKAAMTFRDQGLTFEEVQEKLKDQTPEAQQMKAIEELSSSMKLLQKVLNFNSPFEAFFKGLSKNASASKDAKSAFMALSNSYQAIHDFALKLDASTVQALMDPIVLIANAMRDIFNSKGFRGGLNTFVRGLGSLLTSIFNISSSEKIHHELDTMLHNMDEKQKKQFAEDITIFDNALDSKSSLKQIRDGMKKKKEQSEAERFRLFLKEARKQSLNNPKVKAEFEKMMEAFNSKYTGWSSLQKKSKITIATDNATNTLVDILDGNAENFANLFKLSGGTLGSVIKGIAVGFIASVNLLSYILDKVDTNESLFQDKGKGVIESFFNWEPGELNTLVEGLIKSMSTLFSTGGGQLGFFTTWLIKQFGYVMWELAGLFFVALKGVAQGIMPGMFKKSTPTFKEASIKSVVEPNYGKGLNSAEGTGATSRLKESTAFDASDSKSVEDFTSVMTSLKSADKGGLTSEIAKDLSEKVESNSVGTSDYSKAMAAYGMTLATDYEGEDKSTSKLTAQDAKSLYESFGSTGHPNRLLMRALLEQKSLKNINGVQGQETLNQILSDINNDKYKDKNNVDDLVSLAHKGNPNLLNTLSGKYLYELHQKYKDTHYNLASKISDMDYMKMAEAWALGIDRAKKDQDQKQQDLKMLQISNALSGTSMLDGSAEMSRKTSALAAKPGGLWSEMISDMGQMTSTVMAAIDNTGLFGSASVKRKSSEIVDIISQGIENAKKVTELLNSPLVVEMSKHFDDDEVKNLIAPLLRNGLLEQACSPKTVSPSAKRFDGSLLISQNYNDAYPGDFEGQDYG